MDDLHQALNQISSIRRQLAQTTEFRGLGPATLAVTGGLAVTAAVVQAVWLPLPAARLGAYLGLWIGTAACVILLSSVQMYTRARRLHSGLSDEMIHIAVEQFLPAFGAGTLVTVVIVLNVPGAAWMLPGLWQILFSLGVFASCRFLPKAMPIAGFWYLVCGLATLALGNSRALAPWTMGGAFGCGQMLIAAVLFFARYKEPADGR